MNDISLPQTTPSPDDRDAQSRRDFLRSLGKWSGAAITAAVVGPFVAPPQAQAGGAWVNRRYGGGYGGGSAGWVNRGGGYGGGSAGWVNRGGGYGGGSAGWINNRYGGGGGGWVNHRYGGGGGGWVNRW